MHTQKLIIINAYYRLILYYISCNTNIYKNNINYTILPLLMRKNILQNNCITLESGKSRDI